MPPWHSQCSTLVTACERPWEMQIEDPGFSDGMRYMDGKGFLHVGPKYSTHAGLDITPVLQIVETWAQQTLFWRENNLSFTEWEGEMKKRYWHPGSGHYGMELHVAKGEIDREHFIIGLAHLADHFFRLLDKKIKGDLSDHCNLPWGEEVIRLTPAAVITLPNHDKKNLDISMVQPDLTATGKEIMAIDEFNEMIQDFAASDVFEIASNAVDVMSYIRQCIKVVGGAIWRNLDESNFWNGVVSDTVVTMKEAAFWQSSSSFHKSSEECEVLSNNFTHLSDTGIKSSSFGSCEALGLFKSFSPAYRSQSDQSAFLIRDLIAGMRMGDSKVLAVQMWSFNDKLVVNLQGSAKWQSPKAWEIFKEVFKEILTDIATKRYGSSAEVDQKPILNAKL
ncbi:hypothetical protein K435DRAFT_900969 [Dendrothele bispora CBS 962.96]|uniref:Uncharacterized protein n=1 Tax=Dendrothele bispora (strain CBS 962.96) TaxID=1314807 RepID=A0A4S8LWJ4_DENBC|nr:hypothetical protein K435DRAFT_900969 [Dendrothele bispora CBS 962.96]